MIKVIDQAAVDYLNWLGGAIHNCALPATNQVRAAAGCLAIAQEHHRAIVVLLDHDRFASAFAVLHSWIARFGSLTRWWACRLCGNVEWGRRPNTQSTSLPK